MVVILINVDLIIHYLHYVHVYILTLNPPNRIVFYSAVTIIFTIVSRRRKIDIVQNSYYLIPQLKKI